MMATETEQLILIRRPWGETLVGLMRNDFATDHRRERYVVEVDGRAKAEYLTFIKALTAGLKLRQEFPKSQIKLRDVDIETAR
jgi:hypothetical protein